MRAKLHDEYEHKDVKVDKHKHYDKKIRKFIIKKRPNNKDYLGI